MGRSLQRNIFDRLRTLQGRNPQGAPRPLFPLRIPPSNRARSRTLPQNSTSPTNKNFPRDPATHKKRNKIPSSEWRGHGGSSRRVWEAWRERESSFKRTPSPSKVFPLPHSPLQPKGSEGGVTENGFQSGQQVTGYGERAPKQNAAGETAAAVKRQIRAVGIYLP